MPNAAFDKSMPQAGRRQRSRREKLGIGMSVFAFFGAIGVIGGFSLTGFDNSPDVDEGSEPFVFEGGYAQGADAQGAANADADAEAASADDDYFVGSYGDPVTELYEESDDGGWGENTAARAETVSESRRKPPGSITRGRGGNPWR